MVVSRPAGRILDPLLLLLMAAAVTPSTGAAPDATLLRPDRVFDGSEMKGGELVRASGS